MTGFPRAGDRRPTPRTGRVLACVVVLTGTLVATAGAQAPTGQQPTPPRPPAPGTAAAPPGPNFLSNVKWHLDFGGQGLTLDGARPGKFQETSDVAKGFYLRTLEMDARS